VTDAEWSLIVRCAEPIVSILVIPWAIRAYQNRTRVQVTDQQRAAVQSALTTAAGLVETRLDQGDLKLSDVVPDHPEILAEASAALARVPDAAAAVGISLNAAAHIVVGRVDTSTNLPPIAIPARA
jgi:hypothetical protein